MFLQWYVFIFKWCFCFCESQIFRIKPAKCETIFQNQRISSKCQQVRLLGLCLSESCQPPPLIPCFFLHKARLGDVLPLLFYTALRNTKKFRRRSLYIAFISQKKVFWMLLLLIEPRMYVCVLMFASKTGSKQNMLHLYNTRRYGTTSGWQYIFQQGAERSVSAQSLAKPAFLSLRDMDM